MNINLLFAIIFLSYIASVADLRSEEKIPYLEKNVWTITYVRTKPGKFNEYILNISNNWLSYIRKMREDGGVLSYKILSVQFPRDNEPNLLLLVEYKNMAHFDKGNEYWEKIIAEVSGSIKKLSSAAVDRESLRKIRGQILMREIDFAK